MVDWSLRTLLSIATLLFVTQSWANDDMQRLFLTPEQREGVDERRDAFLKNPTEIVTQNYPLSALKSPSSRTSRRTIKSHKPAQPLSVSAVVLLPNGDQLVRINQRFYKVDTAPDTAMATQVNVQGESVLIPVGETYFPDKKQWMKTYKAVEKGAKLRGNVTPNSTASKPSNQIKTSADQSSKTDLKVLQKLQDTPP